ncbi:hypothetical protein J6590_047984 [Homalodisca vitripennis]|nr:hypothetical protein J6590_090452 [Homalodisca vitripennis]KAG8292084.1 hypothetical protein J6590_047984 [Homalodisca vitripennis]
MSARQLCNTKACLCVVAKQTHCSDRRRLTAMLKEVGLAMSTKSRNRLVFQESSSAKSCRTGGKLGAAATHTTPTGACLVMCSIGSHETDSSSKNQARPSPAALVEKSSSAKSCRTGGKLGAAATHTTPTGACLVMCSIGSHETDSSSKNQARPSPAALVEKSSSAKSCRTGGKLGAAATHTTPTGACLVMCSIGSHETDSSSKNQARPSPAALVES